MSNAFPTSHNSKLFYRKYVKSIPLSVLDVPEKRYSNKNDNRQVLAVKITGIADKHKDSFISDHKPDWFQSLVHNIKFKKIVLPKYKDKNYYIYYNKIKSTEVHDDFYLIKDLKTGVLSDMEIPEFEKQYQLIKEA